MIYTLNFRVKIVNPECSIYIYIYIYIYGIKTLELSRTQKKNPGLTYARFVFWGLSWNFCIM